MHGPVPSPGNTKEDNMKEQEEKVAPVGFHFHPSGGGLVEDTASVDLSAYVGKDARVSDYAQVHGYARVYDNAQVHGYARVHDYVQVYDSAQVCDNAQVHGYARVYDSARVHGYAQVYGGAWETSPLYIQGSRHALTNVAKGKIAIGCHMHTFAEWARHAEKIGKAEGYTDEQIAEYQRYIALFAEIGK
jgi:carbonic anhydrase/acetyltransferase-like protein (isoleucine patch superfamily)